MQNLFFIIIGGDKRQSLLYKSLKEKGLNVKIIYNGEDVAGDLDLIKKGDVIILPVPISRDGSTLFAPNFHTKIEISEIAKRIPKTATVFSGGEHPTITGCNAKEKIDLLADESLTVKNAMATAEAALSVIINNTDFTLFGSKVTLLGFGRISKILARYLTALNSDVTVVARRKEILTLAQISGFKTSYFKDLKDLLKSQDIIINTVPAKVLTENELKVIKKDALVVDLASKPGGIDFETAEKLNLNVNQALSLPGKFSPKSAALYIEELIISYITNRSD